MNYALLDENSIVENIIWLYPGLAEEEFPEAKPIGELLVEIGDEYRDGDFYHNGEKILTREERDNIVIAKQAETIAELDTAILDMTYNSLLEA